METQRAGLFFPQPLQKQGLLFWIWACGARRHRKEVNGMSGLAQMLQAVRAFVVKVFANVVAGTVGNGAEKIQLIIFI